MEPQPNFRKIPWDLISIFFSLSLGILIIGYFYYVNQVTHIKQEKQSELAAIMQLKIKQIISWRKERVADGNVILNDPFFTVQVKDFLKGKRTPELKKQIFKRMEIMRFYEYENIILLDAQGKVALTFPQGRETLDPHTRKLVTETIRTKKMSFSDLYLCDDSKIIRLSLVVPLLLSEGRDNDLIGVILVSIDPQQFLFPLIKSWPTPSRTAETELLRREGNEVVFLNELRHRQGTALTLRFPISEPNLVSAMAARGEKGPVEGRDYRGIAVLGAIGDIPDSLWFLAVEIDVNEVFAPIRAYANLMTFLMVALVVGAGAGLAFIWRNQQVASYRRQLKTERERQALAQRYEYLSRYANDVILLADQDLQILEANDRALDSYGYGRDELLKMSLKDLHPSEIRTLLGEKLQYARDQDGLIFETFQQRKNGATFPVEISLRLLEVEGQKIYQEIIRDITERKVAEESLHELTSELMTAQEAERLRISMLMHDELGQALLVLKFQISTIKDKLKEDNNILSSDCEDLLQYLKGLIDHVRRLSRDLNPPTVLEDLGFGQALKYLIEEFADHYDIRQNRGDIDEIDQLFSKQDQIHIYRIFQESLANIGRHAQAKGIIAEIKKKGNYVSFMIQDDGKGFDMGRVLGRKTMSPGLGMTTLTERVKLLGGSINIWSKKGAGTRITFNIPLDTQ